MSNLTLQTGLDLITGALRRINSYAPGQKLEGVDTTDALSTMNDLLDAWSIEELMIYGSAENILTWVPGKNQYTLGNPVIGSFTGTLVAASKVISGVTIPSGLVLGSAVTDTLSSLPSGTTVTAIGTNTVTVSNNAISTQATPETFQFTVPGDFAIARPLRITAAFTRISGLDFSIELKSQHEWTPLLYKTQPSPWPLLAYYNNAYPYGILSAYPTPSQAGELHLWTDTILSQFASVNQAVNLPQGYARMIKWNLAEELWPEYYDDPVPQAILKNAKTSRAAIEALNALPMPVSSYDTDIVRARTTDAGWILHGGFR